MNAKSNLDLTKVILLGYSGHALVVAETLSQAGFELAGYLDICEVSENLLSLPYLGFEKEPSTIDRIQGFAIFPAIGNNQIRCTSMNLLLSQGFYFLTAISPLANLSSSSNIGVGTLICKGVSINPFTRIGKGVIINTGAIVEHECMIGDFAHIAPGAVLAGNVHVGKKSFIGANSVVKQGVKIGENVIIGAGSVVLHDIDDDCIFAGNPAKKIH